MEKDEMIRLRQANFRQTNAYAMQNGIILGIWGIASQACYVGGLAQPALSTMWLVMLLGIPVVTWMLTLRFRKIVGMDINFPFARGFMHAFLALLYCAVWAGVATFVYMQFFDNGFIFDQWAKAISSPEVTKMLDEAGYTAQINETMGGISPVDLVNELRHVGAGNWAAMVIYTYMLSSPIIAVIVGLLSMHRVHYKRN